MSSRPEGATIYTRRGNFWRRRAIRESKKWRTKLIKDFCAWARAADMIADRSRGRDRGSRTRRRMERPPMAESLTACMNCMEAMRSFPDKFFDLAVVDPPYGDAAPPDTHTHSAGTGTGSTSTTMEPLRRALRPIQVPPPNDTRTQLTDGGKVSVHRTGGGWAAKIDPGKKS